ncbi:tRNA (adenosine(37)-N6)-threonylcarbamoyltransferase complex dimerization subunit type 1 TsaB [Carboxydochorda subterranea]|uniref:tRNA (Adenosine(37)-N6)-threonylcarbamoyltransferase complex dimerization subunit type 1 TsaB n=1 Tax=Carboxydichorda subterranea TaxID=3109565 RepID=A0ABZ1BZ63_9FIRM|nr:tRNA (adenosine(37)-N6)-threonylcarbamoyltransferase complex dimerization subunit type 1 TsaB [Limnochorda sp. L945t]WRP18023.1 tRNA (adenosine(37)-N6)-threonylcarbamoyltransferase complex dimerization subunit type 1 TsaB [Limnochorda sp. L945t]
MAFERILAIDTSGPAAGVALFARDGWWVQTWQGLGGRGEQLTGVIDRALAEAGFRGQDLDGIAVAAGPGSYTGLRVGLAVAKTLAWAWQRPLAGVDTLAAMALGALWAAPVVVAAIDARHGEVFGGVYGRGQEAPVEAWWGPRAAPVEELARALGEVADRRGLERAAAAGDGCLAHRDALVRLSPVEYVWVPEQESRIVQVVSVGILGRLQLETGRHDDPAALDARYLKATEAERRWLQKS